MGDCQHIAGRLSTTLQVEGHCCRQLHKVVHLSLTIWQPANPKTIRKREKLVWNPAKLLPILLQMGAYNFLKSKESSIYQL